MGFEFFLRSSDSDIEPFDRIFHPLTTTLVFPLMQLATMLNKSHGELVGRT